MLYGLTYSLSRYAVPLRPLLAVAVAWAATHRVDVLARLRAARPDLAIVFAGHREAVHALADRVVALPAPPVTDATSGAGRG